MISYSGGTPFGEQQMPQSVGPTQVGAMPMPGSGPSPVMAGSTAALIAQALKAYGAQQGPNTAMAGQQAGQAAAGISAAMPAPQPIQQ